MRIFISWSGELSREVATILHKYIPLMIQGVDAFMSQHNLESGSRWSIELAKELDQTNFGIICLTQDNLNSPWILFEAGALSKHFDGRICGILVGDLKPSYVTGPLAQFQHRFFNETEIRALFNDINSKTEKSISEHNLSIIFDHWWSIISGEYEKIKHSSHVQNEHRPDRNSNDILEELLVKMRAFERAIDMIDQKIDVKNALEIKKSRKKFKTLNDSETIMSNTGLPESAGSQIKENISIKAADPEFQVYAAKVLSDMEKLKLMLYNPDYFPEESVPNTDR